MQLLIQLIIYEAFWNVHDTPSAQNRWNCARLGCRGLGLGPALPLVTRQCGLEQVLEALQTLDYLTVR